MLNNELKEKKNSPNNEVKEKQNILHKNSKTHNNTNQKQLAKQKTQTKWTSYRRQHHTVGVRPSETLDDFQLVRDRKYEPVVSASKCPNAEVNLSETS